MRFCLLLLIALLYAPATALADDCARLNGYWQPLYDETVERFPAMRQWLEIEVREFIEPLLLAQRMQFDCTTMQFRPSQGEIRKTPVSFIIVSADGGHMLVDMPEGRRADILLRPDGLLELGLPSESYVLRKSAPYQPTQ